MEKSSLEQQGIITDLEHTYQDLKEQQVVTHIKFDKEKKVLLLKSKIGKVSMRQPRYN
jgi:hypothetical protein